MIITRSGAALIVASGLTTTYFGEPLVLGVEEEGWAAAVVMIFRSDPENPALSLQTYQDPGGAHYFELVNFDMAQGKGTSVPALLGEAGEGWLWLHFRVFRYGQTPDYTVHYTFFWTPTSAHPPTPAAPEHP